MEFPEKFLELVQNFVVLLISKQKVGCKIAIHFYFNYLDSLSASVYRKVQIR